MSYTDGSRTAHGVGVGILGKSDKIEKTIALGIHPTVFQTEMLAKQHAHNCV